MQPIDNIAIFADTADTVQHTPRLLESVRKSIATQSLVREGDIVPNGEENHRFDAPAEIIVSKERTFEAAQAYADGTQKVAVLNFASSVNPGGGVVGGARAQEECLCRCSTLYFCLNIEPLWEQFYLPHRANGTPLHNDDLIYTPNVTVFKTDTLSPVTMDEDAWYNVDVITCAAPNLRERPSNRHNRGDGVASVSVTDEQLAAIHEQRGRRILDVAVQHNVDVLILGAFGCGAFMNNPAVVADVWLRLARRYAYAFKTIAFAVYCPPHDDTNFREFEKQRLATAR